MTPSTVRTVIAMLVPLAPRAAPAGVARRAAGRAARHTPGVVWRCCRARGATHTWRCVALLLGVASSKVPYLVDTCRYDVAHQDRAVHPLTSNCRVGEGAVPRRPQHRRGAVREPGYSRLPRGGVHGLSRAAGETMLGQPRGEQQRVVARGSRLYNESESDTRRTSPRASPRRAQPTRRRGAGAGSCDLRWAWVLTVETHWKNPAPAP